MTVHLIKMAVGVESRAHLAELQRARLQKAESEGRTDGLRHVTRYIPKRTAELLDGGSIYWVIGGVIRVRQRLLAVNRLDDGTHRRCALILDPALVLVEPRGRGFFQGWRYLEGRDAPPDLPDSSDPENEMPSAMASELRELGLL